MDLSTSLRDHTARVVKDFIASGPKGACSRATVLALTALGIAATTGAGSAAVLLSSFGINIGASALFEFLRKLSDKGPGGPTLEDALAAVQASSEQEQHALQQVADRVDVMPMVFSEALAQHRHELVADFGGLLATWSSTLPFVKIEAMLERIGEETRGIAPMQADLLVITGQLTALRDGLLRDLDGHLAPLTAEVLALRAQVDALLVQLAAGSPGVAPRPGRPSGDRLGRSLTNQVMAAIQEEMRRETGSLLS
jgi:hypothetical protein